MADPKAKYISYKDPMFGVMEAAHEVNYNLPRGMMAALRTRGEASNNDQSSPAGARGVYQFIPATFAKFSTPGSSPVDPEAASLAAAKYLRYALDQYGGNVGAALAEYNGGPKAAKAYLRTGDPGNKETRDYIARVLPAIRQPDGTLPDKTAMADTSQSQAFGTPDSGGSILGGYELGSEPQYNISPVDAGVDQNFNVNIDEDIGQGASSPEFAADIALDDKIGTIVDEVLRG